MIGKPGKVCAVSEYDIEIDQNAARYVIGLQIFATPINTQSTDFSYKQFLDYVQKQWMYSTDDEQPNYR